MEISFSLFDRSDKRWHAKSVRHAANSLGEKISQIEPDLKLEGLCAKFELGDENTVRVVEETSKDGTYFSIMFATNNWDSLSESLDDCEKQLASALQAILFTNENPSAGQKILELSGSNYNSSFTSRTIKDDGLFDIYWYIEQTLDVNAFFSLIDELDAFLSKHKLGQVSGNSYSVSGISSCIDIVTPDGIKVISAIKEFAAEFGINKYEFGGEYA